MTISRIAQAYVVYKLAKFASEAASGCGQHYELYTQSFTDRVDALAGRMRNENLREFLLNEARNTGDYCDGEGRWLVDAEGELSFIE